MADAAARRREARKRKLLMSSEDRLNRILQLNAQTKEEQTADKEVETSTSDQSTSTQPSLDINVASTLDQEATINEAQPSLNRNKSSPQSSTVNKDQEEVTENLSKDVVDKSLATSDVQGSPSPNVEDSLSQNLANSSSSTVIRRTQSRTTTETQEPSHGSPSLTQDPKASMPKTKTVISKQQSLSGREMVCIVFAIVMRGLLACDWLVKYTGQSIIIPFLALQLMLQALTSNQNKPAESGGMLFRVLSMALMFSNIPPETVSKVKNIIAVFATVFTDFTLYLFTFITVHCIFEVIG